MSLPPPPAAETGAAAGWFIVSATASLEGLLTATLVGDGARTTFATTLAAQLGVSSASVVVSSTTDMVAGPSSARRRRRGMLSVMGVDVAFTVAAPSYAAAAAVSAGLTALDMSALLSALNAAGLAATGVVISVPTLAAQAAPPPPPTPPGVVLPTVSAVRVSPSASLALPASRTTLTVDVVSAAPASLVLQWRVLSTPPLDLSDATRVGTPLNTATLGLLPGALLPGSAYTFMLTARDANGNATASVQVVTMHVPAGGALTVHTANGMELETRFLLSTSGWSDGNPDANGDGTGDGYPLEYMFSYVSLGAVRCVRVLCAPAAL
jgi:hypothetical protein